MVQFRASVLRIAASSLHRLDGDERIGTGQVSFYAAVFFLVNATYICLVHELIDRATVDDVSLRERRIMRFRSIVTLCVFGAAALVALKFPLVEKSCPAPYCGNSPTRRWQSTGGPSPSPARADDRL